MSDALSTLWQRLANEGSAESGWVRLRVPGLPSIPLYVARSATTGLDGLVLEIPTPSIDPSALKKQTAGLEVTTEPISPGRSGTTRVILELADRAFEDIFRALAADLAASLEGLTDVSTAGHEFSRRLTRWQRFLQAHGPDGLSPSQCTGLVGELLILEQLLASGADPADVLDAWTGPDQDARDFALPLGDLEVKTTASMAPSEVGISSLEQLDTRSGRRLVLHHTVLSRNPTVGRTLPEIAEAIAALSDDAVGLFRDKLLAAGYLDAHVDRYGTPKYQVITESAYDVVDAFPRLVSSNTPDGVTRATYSLSLAAIQNHTLQSFHPASLLNEDTADS